MSVGEVLTRDTTNVVSLANKFIHPKQVDLDRSNICTKIHTKFIRIHFYIYRSIITKKKSVW